MMMKDLIYQKKWGFLNKILNLDYKLDNSVFIERIVKKKMNILKNI
jgi:hypothetical protein